MPQKTNLNISPYFDDFDPDKNFYRVLFKPGYPVQARELTTLQSILQHQVESFGSHIFKEGSMVIPGGITYDDGYYSVKINQDHLGVDVTVYIKNLIDKRIQGQTSGIVAVIKNYSVPPNDDVDDITLYVKYLSSGDSLEINQFDDGETLIVLENVTYGNTTISSGDTIADLSDTNATNIGSAVGLDKGIYFIRGTFVDVPSSVVVLDPYSNIVSYRVGLTILEELVTENDDSSLNDNAKGFSNYAAPGADRLKISTFLSKKSLDDFDDKNFVELIRIQDGEIKKLQDKTVYSIIKDYFAKRTFEESGDYSISTFDIDILNSLNDGISNEGIYLSSEKTEQGNTPSDDLMCVKVSSGKAYVRGYDVDLPGSTILDVEKPRDTKTISNSLIPFEMGNLLRVNNVFGVPFADITSSGSVINLYNQRRNSTTAGTGTLVGKARVYSFSVTDAAYTNASTEWDLYLFDVQTYTEIVLNESVSGTESPATSYVQGLSSNASGYVVSGAGSNTLLLSQTSGSFIEGEQLSFNGTSLTSRSIVRIKAYNTDDIKSVYQDCTSITSALKSDFVADTALYTTIPSRFSVTDRITINNTGIVTCPGKNFLGIRSDTVVRYQIPDLNIETFNRVISISADGLSMQLGTVPNVTNVNSGALPINSISLIPFKIGYPELRNQDNIGLYTPLNAKNISNVNLSGADLIVQTQVTELSTNSVGTLTINAASTGISSAFFESFDAERYSVHYLNGSIEQLTSDQFTLNNDGTQVTLSGLTVNQSSNVTVNVTLRKNDIKSKIKNFIRSEKLIVDKTSIGISTGLTTSSYYGLRVEDQEISLNYPDVVNIVAIYESLDVNTPIPDKLTLVSGLNLDINSIVGEKIVGSSSGAIAQLVTRTSSTEVEFVYLNSRKFQVGENATFQESQITSSIQLITKGSYLNITNRFVLDKGQKEQYYDYSKIVRSQGSASPSKKLLVIFNRYDISINDDGDIITVSSYDGERFLEDIPTIANKIRSTDSLDFRPRVQRFTSTSASPFDFSSRAFIPLNLYNAISPNESSIVGYSYYLPRIDKVVLNKLGQLSLIRGVSSDTPKVPLNIEEAMDVATIELPAYLYDPKDVKVTLVDNRRYTMRDIGKLEDRIENLEVTTSLSLLELDTKTLQVQDADGLSRFKTGFFVDDFKNNDFIEKNNPDVVADVDISKKELITPVDFWSLKMELALTPSINTNTADFSQDLPLLDPNVRKTGDLITLNYEEAGWIEQPLASNVENVNPFNVIEYSGGIVLQPASDNWVRNIYIENRRTVYAQRQTTSVTTTRVRTGPWWWWWWRRPAQETTTTTTSVSGSPIGEYDYVESIRVTEEPDVYMRSRNVEFRSGGLKPSTRHYPYIDDISSIDYIPKLIEITMVSGNFQVGENIRAFSGQDQILYARLARPDHKNGTYNSPNRTYMINPYDRTSSLPTAYSASSTVLNIDTFSLAEESITKYGGYVEVDTQIVGETSGAIATIRDLRLITDNYGDLIGSFYIRDPNDNPPPLVRLKTGTRTFRLTAVPVGFTPIPGSTTFASSAEGGYTANGTTQTQVTNIVQVRNPPPPPPPPPPQRRGGKDPLAQSFTVDETGAFLTSVDVYFASKDPNEKLYLELRTVELGTPTNRLVQDYARVILEPNEIQISADASVATRITFPSPVYLQPRTEYALVFLAPTSDAYEMWVGTMGQKTVNTQNLPNAESVVVTKQYSGGSLFKSQNGTIWTASQFQDLKFKLYKAKFTSQSGDVVFYNPPIRPGESTVPFLNANSVRTLPRKVRVGITTNATMDTILTTGRKVSSGASGPIGVIESVGGPINTLSIANVGSGYSTGAFQDVELYSIFGSGSGAKATINFLAGSISAVPSITNVNDCRGYKVGDVLGIVTSTVVRGSGARLSIADLTGIDTLYTTDVQGETFTPGANLVYYDGNTRVSTSSTFITSSQVVSPLYSGNVIEVTQFNHGMHGNNNKVQIVNIEPDATPIAITASLGISDSTISVASTTPFSSFEGITTSRGYLKLNSEIIYYDSIGTGTLGISTRGVDGTAIRTHASASLLQKYELNGASLTKLNRTHDLSSNSTLKQLKDFDSYYIEFDRETRPSGDNQISFTSEKFAGGPIISASQNYQFSTIIPQFNIITPGQTTTVSAQLRTVSGTSAGGSEVSFIDQGYQPVELNKANFLTTPRLVASEINETTRLTSLPKNKSATIRIRMQSEDPNLSPVLDTQTALVVLGRNKINNPIKDYVTDGRVNQVTGDPHSAIYISRKVDLQQPATSLKVLIGAYRPSQADFRVLYKLFKSDSSEIEQSFILFPGYDNLKDTNGDGFGDEILNIYNNSGRPDKIVRASRDNEFLEYQFSVDELDPFTGFQIKIVMNSTNESFVTKFKDLRVIALA